MIDENLLDAAKRGDVDAVSLLLDAGAEIEAIDEDGQTALMLAATWNHQTDVISLLLKRGANVNAVDRYGSTALIEAAAMNRIAIVHRLLDFGADINSGYPNGALHFAVLNRNYEIARLLMQADAKVGLFDAAMLGDIDLLRKLLDEGAPLEMPHDNHGTALQAAIGEGHTEVVRFLLDRGANVNDRHPGGYTAIVNAAEAGHLDIVRLLIARGAKVNGQDGQAALKFAIQNGRADIVEALKRAGAKERSVWAFLEDVCLLASDVIKPKR